MKFGNIGRPKGSMKNREDRYSFPDSNISKYHEFNQNFNFNYISVLFVREHDVFFVEQQTLNFINVRIPKDFALDLDIGSLISVIYLANNF